MDERYWVTYKLLPYDYTIAEAFVREKANAQKGYTRTNSNNKPNVTNKEESHFFTQTVRSSGSDIPPKTPYAL